ncbi:MAG: MarR family transcriptional regulator [Oscillospiraceae bacterium]|nr:MarR family transcriptional regulator [Oscillospiraceae bacterium]
MNNNIEIDCAIASMWIDILMKSSTTDDVGKYGQLSNYTPTEINLILLVGNTQNMLLREFLEILKIPKSTLTSIINRLEKREYINRVINQRDKRSFGLKLTERGKQFMELYTDYQKEMGTKILRGLNSEEQQQLFHLLKKISACVIPPKIESEEKEND